MRSTRKAFVVGFFVANVLPVFAWAQVEEAPPSPLVPRPELWNPLVGDWDVTVTTTADGKPRTSSGTESASLYAQDVFLLTRMHLENDSKPFDAIGLRAWDRFRGACIGYWISSDATAPTRADGTWDASKKTLTFRGEMAAPDGKRIPFRSVLAVPDDDHHAQTVHVTGADGQETVAVEMKYVRRKGGAPSSPPTAATSPATGSEPLAPYLGNWTLSRRISSGDTQPGEETCALVCGGKWIWTDQSLMFGQYRSEGHEILGYEPATKQFHLLTFDGSGRVFGTFQGDSPDGKTLTLRGDNYPWEHLPKRSMETWTCTDANSRIRESSLLDDKTGRPFEPVRTTYTRHK